MSSTSEAQPSQLIERTASDLAAAIRNRQLTAAEVTEAAIARTEQTAEINAFVVRMFESARQTAAKIDAKLDAGEDVGPLAGVPISIKECFHIEGTDATIGLTSYHKKPSAHTGRLPQLLMDAGGVVIGKTNVPQLMVIHESTNPVYGQTHNPWNLERTCGGSSGGEAAAIAAGCTAIGLGGDLGGSIRIPSHFCGIAGIKPTTGRIAGGGSAENFRGLTEIRGASGPLARSVDDLALAMHVLTQPREFPAVGEPPLPQIPLSLPEMKPGKVALAVSDPFFPACPAVVRAVTLAGDALRGAGWQVDEVEIPDFEKTAETYLRLMAADGGDDWRQLLQGSTIDPQIARILQIAGMGSTKRAVISKSFHWMGETTLAKLILKGGPLRTWQSRRIAYQKMILQRMFAAWMESNGYAAILCPPYALPAIKHGTSVDLMPASLYAMYFNLLEFPAGVVPVSFVEETDAPWLPADGVLRDSRDTIHRIAAETTQNAVGLPLGVQVAGLPWQEETVLSVMKAIETLTGGPKGIAPISPV